MCINSMAILLLQVFLLLAELGIAVGIAATGEGAGAAAAAAAAGGEKSLADLGHLGLILGSSWAHPGPILAPLGPFGGLLGPFWGYVGLSCDC